MTSILTLPDQIEAYFDRLWPLLRSLTGEGVRQTHDILSEIIPLERIEIPSGSQIFDWQVPKEWVVRNAYLIDPNGNRILDVWENNLHLVNYSVPFQGELSLAELDEHLHTVPELPEAIPYVTSHYAPRWGFCLSQEQRNCLPEGTYKVFIDTDHIDGSMTLGEAVLPGEEKAEVLISTYTCHPSMANNELSGPLVTAFLYQRLAVLEHRRLTYRFIFLPETIGSLAYLTLRGDHLREHMTAGYVVTCVGDAGPYTYKRSRNGDTLADRAAIHVISQTDGIEKVFLDFVPDRGSDERQYCSPGFKLPVGSMTRTMYSDYPEYHTSLDNRDFISFDAMTETVDMYYRIMLALDQNVSYRSLMPFGEPQLGRRGLMTTLATRGDPEETSAIRWVLCFSDGEHDLLSIAERSGRSLELLHSAAQRCVESGLLEPIE
jgi:aminopeptidase-like protein